jgi:hypothetical protein
MSPAMIRTKLRLSLAGFTARFHVIDTLAAAGWSMADRPRLGVAKNFRQVSPNVFAEGDKVFIERTAISLHSS